MRSIISAEKKRSNSSPAFDAAAACGDSVCPEIRGLKKYFTKKFAFFRSKDDMQFKYAENSLSPEEK
jgi:hypothetical protein